MKAVNLAIAFSLTSGLSISLVNLDSSAEFSFCILLIKLTISLREFFISFAKDVSLLVVATAVVVDLALATLSIVLFNCCTSLPTVFTVVSNCLTSLAIGVVAEDLPPPTFIDFDILSYLLRKSVAAFSQFLASNTTGGTFVIDLAFSPMDFFISAIVSATSFIIAFWSLARVLTDWLSALKSPDTFLNSLANVPISLMAWADSLTSIPPPVFFILLSDSKAFTAASKPLINDSTVRLRSLIAVPNSLETTPLKEPLMALAIIFKPWGFISTPALDRAVLIAGARPSIFLSNDLNKVSSSLEFPAWPGFIF